MISYGLVYGNVGLESKKRRNGMMHQNRLGLYLGNYVKKQHKDKIKYWVII